ncbi:hypothetical protein HTZ77_13510 [Nonomuraea sp. SMC257]|uniref:Uncharacterized protein n=1 Tax=Nonomuraea montanisoli TaxID=2741721 RepID=A0A7Y6I8R7_9ACTN|nr:hypothetical protein [Nonomuraea montanisoli]NUW32439.1 hypothetical protein [Nonomuraea montanisoli]
MHKKTRYARVVNASIQCRATEQRLVIGGGTQGEPGPQGPQGPEGEMPTPRS